jgi:HAD superfamily hydrolase (TIGR01509 family)
MFDLLVLFCVVVVSVVAFNPRAINKRAAPLMALGKIDLNFDALLLDCDGVIAETERDAHRVTFNQAFAEKGLLGINWDIELYGKLLKVGGGKERMTDYFTKNNNWPESVREKDRAQFIKDLHATKTGMFKTLVESGAVPLRPGVQRLVDDAQANGIQVAVCSTSDIDAVTTIVRTLLGEERLAKIPIFSGDIVAAKKPDPAVYTLAASTLNVDPSRCWVVEDSQIGLEAGKAAGMSVCVTKSMYTSGEDFTGSDLIVEDLDRGLDGPISIKYLNYKKKGGFKQVKNTDNADMFSAASQTEKMISMINSGKTPGNPFG